MQYKANFASTDELKTRLKSEVDRLRDEHLYCGVTYDDVRYDADPVAIMNITAVVSSLNAGIPLPDPFTWRSADNQSISHDSTTLVELASVILNHRVSCYEKSWTLKDQIDAAEDPSLIDITSGWPS